MFTANSITSLRTQIRRIRSSGATIACVPTMGYLHEGHLSLVQRAQQHADQVIVSIFVNPTQFNNPKDLAVYPQDIKRDLDLLESVGTDGVFLPCKEEMYGPKYQSWITLDSITLPFEGTHRPGHFRGVTTVVGMLFNCVQPDYAVFGEKDFQQLRVIEQMVVDLKFPIQILRGPLMRDPDGLAMSSRNIRLGSDARRSALGISRGLFKALDLFRRGENSAEILRQAVLAELAQPGVEVEYIEVASEDTLNQLPVVIEPARILVAAVIGGVRLIDNIALAR